MNLVSGLNTNVETDKSTEFKEEPIIQPQYSKAADNSNSPLHKEDASGTARSDYSRANFNASPSKENNTLYSEAPPLK